MEKRTGGKGRVVVLAETGIGVFRFGGKGKGTVVLAETGCGRLNAAEIFRTSTVNISQMMLSLH